jgi:protein-S-isoprenylcysteine O-methyltransferase Ste14
MHRIAPLDLPPVWLVACLLLAWAQTAWIPGPALPAWTGLAGAGLALSGLALILAAALQMGRARTTVIPRRDPSALVTTGAFALSRNPIYLGDALILAGLCLRWGAWSGLVLLPAFMILIARRFIAGEEARLAASFPRDFAVWSASTRRWL